MKSLLVLQQVTNFAAFYGSLSSITAFTGAGPLPHVGIQINPILALQTDVLLVNKMKCCPTDLNFNKRKFTHVFVRLISKPY